LSDGELLLEDCKRRLNKKKLLSAAPFALERATRLSPDVSGISDSFLAIAF
jgi:hypothetical protein